jgi:hypothetical protein
MIGADWLQAVLIKLLARDGEVVVKLLGVLIITAVLSAVYFGPATAQEKFRVASGGFSTAIHAVAWAAYEKKLFQKYGLDGEYLALESGTPAMQAMLANELQIVFTTGALAITANLQGADTTIIAGGINFIPNKLLVRPEVKRPEVMPDRKGLEFILSQLVGTNPKAKGQMPESLRLLDSSVLEEIKKSGFIDKFKR